MEKSEPRTPDFKGEGVAVWIANDKNGKKYLRIKVLGNIRLNAFRFKPKKNECL